MVFFDILFPLNIGHLTYRCPEFLSDSVKPGMMVSAALKNRTTKGVVIGKSARIPSGAVKDILDVHGDVPVLGEKMISLLKWMADYYLAEQGLVLKTILPKEAFRVIKKRKTVAGQTRAHSHSPVDIDDSLAKEVLDSVNSLDYKTFLLFPPSSAYEYSFLIKTLSEIRNGIILVPEISMLKNLYPILYELLGERTTLFHGDLSGGKKTEAIERLISGRSDIVIGTRSAVFAPLQKVSFIMVLDEHSKSYKQEKSPYYNARDVAVMRGCLEKATVLLSSICPSVESFFNCKAGKYTLLRPSAEENRPRIKLVDMRREKLVRPYLSKAVMDAAVRCTKKDQKVVFVSNRRGHSTLLQCLDCGHIEYCPLCSIPLVFHKQDMSMKCHYCGYALTNVPERCGGCKGHNLKLSGAGTQKIQEDIEKLTGVEAVRIDSDQSIKKAEMEGTISSAFMDTSSIIVGTKLMTARIGFTDRFSMAAILNADLLLNIPDFRSAEKACQEILAVADRIDPDGEIFVQTRMPQNYLFKYLKNFDYRSFLREEIGRRKSLSYPPYSRLLLMTFVSPRDISSGLSEIVHKATLHNFIEGDRDGSDKDRNSQGIEIIGPYVRGNRQGKNEISLLLKSSVRGKLQATARLFMEAFKESRDVRVKADVDPIVI